MSCVLPWVSALCWRWWSCTANLKARIIGRGVTPLAAGGALALAIVVSLGVTAREEANGARLRVRNFYGTLRILDQVAANIVMVKGDVSQPLDEDPRFGS